MRKQLPIDRSVSWSTLAIFCALCFWLFPQRGLAAPSMSLAWLRSLQDQSGLIQGSISLTDWVVMAVSASGADSDSFSDRSLLETIRSHPLTAPSATDLERRILALRAAAISASPEVDQLTSLMASGQIGSDRLLNDDVFGVLALRAAETGAAVIASSIQFIQANQNTDGGFSSFVGGSSDVDSTAAALAALIVGGGSSDAADRGFQYLVQQQNSDGGFGVKAGNGSNVDSTSWALWAYHTGGRTNRSAETWLERAEHRDGSYGGALSTAYALIAQSRRPLPILSVPQPSRQAPDGSAGTAPIENHQPVNVVIPLQLLETKVSVSGTGASASATTSGTSDRSHSTSVTAEAQSTLEPIIDSPIQPIVRSDNWLELESSPAVKLLGSKQPNEPGAPNSRAAPPLSPVSPTSLSEQLVGQIDAVAARTELIDPQLADRTMVRRLILALSGIAVAELGLLSLGLGRWVANRRRSTTLASRGGVGAVTRLVPQ